MKISNYKIRHKKSEMFPQNLVAPMIISLTYALRNSDNYPHHFFNSQPYTCLFADVVLVNFADDRSHQRSPFPNVDAEFAKALMTFYFSLNGARERLICLKQVRPLVGRKSYLCICFILTLPNATVERLKSPRKS